MPAWVAHNSIDAGTAIGSNDANNVADSTSVTANDDGSVLERLEGILQRLNATDSSTNILGADDADNGFASTNVVRNNDGSIIERLEHIAATLDGAAGIATFPASAAPANDVSMAEVLRAVYDNVSGVDGSTNVLGANDADNGFSSNSVVANADGSVLERQEYIQSTQLATLLTTLERSIVKADGAVLNGDDDLFTVAGGPIMITRFVGRVTTIIGGAANMTIQEAVTTPAGDVAFSTTVAIDSDAAGTTYTFTAASPSVLTPTTAGALVNVPQVNWLAVPGTIQALGSAAQSGVIEWTMTYIPLSPSATVTAAA